MERLFTGNYFCLFKTNEVFYRTKDYIKQDHPNCSFTVYIFHLLFYNSQIVPKKLFSINYFSLCNYILRITG